MSKRTPGRYETTSVGGEQVKAFVPDPLPPRELRGRARAVAQRRPRGGEQLPLGAEPCAGGAGQPGWPAPVDAAPRRGASFSPSSARTASACSTIHPPASRRSSCSSACRASPCHGGPGRGRLPDDQTDGRPRHRCAGVRGDRRRDDRQAARPRLCLRGPTSTACAPGPTSRTRPPLDEALGS